MVLSQWMDSRPPLVSLVDFGDMSFSNDVMSIISLQD